MQLVQGCWEGHLSAGEPAHLFSVWSTPPERTARRCRCQSEERLSVIGPDGSKDVLPLGGSGAGLAAQLLQFLSHAGTKVRANVKAA